MERQMLKDQVAIITGASYGMGRTMAELFAEEGAAVTNRRDSSRYVTIVTISRHIREHTTPDGDIFEEMLFICHHFVL